ncbi:hypothetical protein [Streptomyces sp. NPDC059708]|uniref:hypothetical protein n=1 Tax=Streptomyces sp. NPDC059708 TaxID=3346916 RepID=UPI0036889010
MKKFAAVAGVALAGATLIVLGQGTAQASTTPAAVPAVEAAPVSADPAPMAIGGALGKAWVHAKAACPSVAHAAGAFTDMVSGVSPRSLPEGTSAEVVFDK